MKRLIKANDIDLSRILHREPRKKLVIENEIISQKNKEIKFRYKGQNKVFKIPNDIEVSKKTMEITAAGVFIWDQNILAKIKSSGDIVEEITIDFDMPINSTVIVTWK